MTDVANDSSGEHDQDDDPFASFDAAVGIGQVRDPYPEFHRMHAEAAVHEGPQWHRFGLENHMEAMLVGDATPFTVMPYEVVQRVLKDGATYSSSGYAKLNGVVMGHTIIEMDEPEHHRYRALVQQAFTLKAMTPWEDTIVRPIVERHIDAFAQRGHAELMSELFLPFPMYVIGAILGLPPEDIESFHRKAVELISILTDFEKGMAASQWLYDYFAGIIAERREEPRDDVISMLVEATLDGQQLTDEEIIAFLRLLLPAGAETTYRSGSNLMYALLTHPDQLDDLRADPSLIPRAVEEGLRWEPPLTSVSRTTSKDVELEGVTIPVDSSVLLSIGNANRDPDRWTDPDRFDIRREPKANMAFAWGAHICLGMHLARMESKVVFEVLLDRLPGLRLDPSAEDVHISGFGFRAPNALPVLFDPQD
jgi:cytochrome P450